MAKGKKYDSKGASVGEVDLGQWLEKADANHQMVKDYIVAIRKNKRQWSACTQTRSEVNHSGKKPHKQKGTGNARQGSLASPQYKGGGVVFGPRPKFDQHVRINRKERHKAIAALLGEKARAGHFHIVEDLNFEAPKTAKMAKLLAGIGIKGRSLVIGAGNIVEHTEGEKTYRFNSATPEAQNVRKSVSNLPKADFALLSNVSGYDVMRAADVVITESALKQLMNWETR